MEPIKFPQVNKIWAEDQEEYLPLPTYTDDTETISCWRLTWKDRLRALLIGKLWVRQLNFRNPLQPQAPTFDYPFVDK